jgi:hypothetical protein
LQFGKLERTQSRLGKKGIEGAQFAETPKRPNERLNSRFLTCFQRPDSAHAYACSFS